jgi:hypothetical protein
MRKRDKEKDRLRARDYYRRNRERVLAQQREYDARKYDPSTPEGRENIARRNALDCARSRSRRAADPDKAWRVSAGGHLRRRFGLSIEDWDRLWAAQGGACAICHRVESRKSRAHTRLAIDHDHVTGRVRALLCQTCNRALGLLRDDPAICESAAAYLRRHALEAAS